MCSLCGPLGHGPSWEQQGDLGSSARWQLRREAVEAAREITAFLSPTRVRVAAHAEYGFVVSMPTGGAAIVRSLSEIWHLLERRRVGVPDILGFP